MAARRLTLGQVFALLMVGLALLLGLLFAVLLAGSRQSIIQAADSLRVAAGRRIEDRVTTHLAPAQEALEDLEREIRSGTVDPADTRSLEAALFAQVLNTPHLSELTLTRARKTGFDADGAILLVPAGRTQVSVYRVLASGDDRLLTRETAQERGRWQVLVRDRPAGSGLLGVPLAAAPAEEATDPTGH